MESLWGRPFHDLELANDDVLQCGVGVTSSQSRVRRPRASGLQGMTPTPGSAPHG